MTTQRIAFVGNHLPRRCGIATFTHDLHAAVAAKRPDLETCVVAMSDLGSSYDYPQCVQSQIRDVVIGDYKKSAAFINSWGADVVSLQHEYGIFGGESGCNILSLLAELHAPIVTTLHTVLKRPTVSQHAVMADVIRVSSKLVVMSEMGRALLHANHDVATSKVDVIVHGIPDVPVMDAQLAKMRFGFSGKTVILTFGLLSPSKGIETVIDAMPEIIRVKPHAVYVVLGATHPNLVREQGEAYRDSLMARARNLGITDHVVFINEFVDQPKLLQFIAMCDVYVTPYLNEEQMTSGTLAYSFGMGKAVVSTPYWHAKELLAGGRGILVPFGDANAMGREIASLLGNDIRRHAMCKRAYAASRSMIWPETAKAYLATFDSALDAHVPDPSVIALSSHSVEIDVAQPQICTDHLQAMCDSTGILQHAVHCIPDRHHGYCVDDNARALLLAIALQHAGETRLPDALVTTFATFIQHAWNPDLRRFRNFMSYDRRWLEDRGSEDSQGRTLWVLGRCAAYDESTHRRAWAKALFQSALPASAGFTSPRAWAFVLLGLDAYLRVSKQDVIAARCRLELSDRLMRLLATNARDDWQWFEEVLAYDNARLPEALLVTGSATGNTAYIAAGIKTLRWLMARQTAKAGHFRPVGSNSFGNRHALPAKFDQQPIEAAATISACIAASAVDDSADWDAHAVSAFRWFTGANDLRTPLADPDSGGCFDGLHADRPNMNMGAESVLAYLMSVVEIRQLLRARAKNGAAQFAQTRAVSA